MFHFCVRLIVLWTQRLATSLTASFLVRATRGAKMPTGSGINFRTKFTISSTGLNSLIVLGVGKLAIAFMRSSPIRIPSTVSTCHKYLTSRGPNCTLGGFRVRPVACSALNMFSSSCRWPSQADEQHMQSSIYTKRALFLAKVCES